MFSTCLSLYSRTVCDTNPPRLRLFESLCLTGSIYVPPIERRQRRGSTIGFVSATQSRLIQGMGGDQKGRVFRIEYGWLRLFHSV